MTAPKPRYSEQMENGVLYFHIYEKKPCKTAPEGIFYMKVQLTILNNTPNASRKICAPVGVTFFIGASHAV